MILVLAHPKALAKNFELASTHLSGLNSDRGIVAQGMGNLSDRELRCKDRRLKHTHLPIGGDDNSMSLQGEKGELSEWAEHDYEGW